MLKRAEFAASYAMVSEVDVTVYNMFTVEQVMAKKLVTVSPETTIKQVLGLL